MVINDRLNKDDLNYCSELKNGGTRLPGCNTHKRDIWWDTTLKETFSRTNESLAEGRYVSSESNPRGCAAARQTHKAAWANPVPSEGLSAALQIKREASSGKDGKSATWQKTGEQREKRSNSLQTPPRIFVIRKAIKRGRTDISKDKDSEVFTVLNELITVKTSELKM